MLSNFSSNQMDTPAAIPSTQSTYRVLRRDQSPTSEYYDNPATMLVLEDYFHTIPKQIFSSTSDTISSVEFFKMTIFTNFQLALMNFRNLQFLKFTNLSMDEYQRWKPHDTFQPFPFISTPNLLQIKFSHFGELTKAELIILDFFTQIVSSPTLASVHFTQKNCFRFEGPLPTLEENEVMNKFGQEIGSWTLYNFLGKNSSSIKSLTIERHGFSFFPPLANQIYVEDALAKLSESLQLKQLLFLVDTSGIEQFLPFQFHVEQLSCKWHLGCQAHPGQVTRIIWATAKCCEYNPKLVSIEIPGCIQVDPEQHPNFEVEPECTTTDFQNFKNCSSLITLYVEEACESKADRDDQIFLGSFINSQFLPRTLRSLRIVVGRVDEWEFQLLTSHFQNLPHLDSFLVRSRAIFYISEISFRNMLKIPRSSVNSLVICNGIFNLDFQPHQLLKSVANQNGRDNESFWKLIISHKWLSLRKDNLAYSFVA